MNEDTHLLVHKAKAGDLAAFEELVRTYQNKVYGLCRQLTGHSEDSQDLAQEVFIRAFRAIGSFRGEADFGTWLHRVTVNIWLNQRRKLSQKQTIVSLDETYPDDEGGSPRHVVADDGVDPQLALESKELQILVRAALKDLSEEHRAVLVLREMEGYSYEEVSQMLDCTLGTVKSRLNRARSALKRRIMEIASGQGEPI